MATDTRQSYFDPLVLAKISTMTLRAAMLWRAY